MLNAADAYAIGSVQKRTLQSVALSVPDFNRVVSSELMSVSTTVPSFTIFAHDSYSLQFQSVLKVGFHHGLLTVPYLIIDDKRPA